MRELLLVRFGEIFLKGLNRPYFQRELVKRIKYAVKELGGKVWLNDSRIFVSDFSDMDECIRRVTKVFGVHSVCPAVEMSKEDFSAIQVQAALSGARRVSVFNRRGGSFDRAVETAALLEREAPHCQVEVCDLADKHHIVMPGRFTMLVRSFLTIEGVMEQLCPELNLFDII